MTILTPTDQDCDGTPVEMLTGKYSATIFCLHHTHELQERQEYCLDLSGTEIAGQLQQDIFALKNGDAIYRKYVFNINNEQVQYWLGNIYDDIAYKNTVYPIFDDNYAQQAMAVPSQN